MHKKRSAGVLISYFLLILFSVVAFPLDFFHHHEAEEITACSDSNGKSHCTHKVHLTEKSSYCWVCAIHFDKSFISDEVRYEYLSRSYHEIAVEKVIIYPALQLLSIQLRGPPAVEIPSI